MDSNSEFQAVMSQMEAQFATTRASNLRAALSAIIGAIDSGYEPRAVRAIAERALHNS
jgi:hypothetical protein